MKHIRRATLATLVITTLVGALQWGSSVTSRVNRLRLRLDREAADTADLKAQLGDLRGEGYGWRFVYRDLDLRLADLERHEKAPPGQGSEPDGAAVGSEPDRGRSGAPGDKPLRDHHEAGEGEQPDQDEPDE